MSDAIIIGTDVTFDAEVLKSDLPVLVGFLGSLVWPLQDHRPVVDEIAEAHKGKLKVVKMNVDENGQSRPDLRRHGHPDPDPVQGGEPQEKVVGESKAKLLERIAKHI